MSCPCGCREPAPAPPRAPLTRGEKIACVLAVIAAVLLIADLALFAPWMPP